MNTIKITGVKFQRYIKDLDPSTIEWRVDDDLYQRPKQRSMINQLIAALKGGGIIADPVTLVTRLWGPASKRSYHYIADGQQRILAAMEVDARVPAIVYTVDSADAEKRLYLKMNERVVTGANNICKSWPGAGAALLRRASETPKHALYERVSFAGPSTRFDAAVLVSGLLAAASGQSGSKSIQHRLGMLDLAMGASDAAHERAESFLKLIGECFNGERPKLLPVKAIGIVANKRWTEAGYSSMPSGRTVGSLKRIKWDGVMGSYATKYLPMFVAKVEEIWR